MQSKAVLSTNAGLTKALLVCGMAAGPLFTLAWLVEGATRANYDPLRYPISSLSIGDSGWMQIEQLMRRLLKIIQAPSVGFNPFFRKTSFTRTSIISLV
jgi:hypothetical protein